MDKQFKSRLINNEVLLGTLLSLPCPQVAESLAVLDFDWLWLDMEHGSINLETAAAMLQAIEPHAAALIRVPENNPIYLKQVLDIGASGVIVPMVKTVEQAQAAVDACLYPPRGNRSVGGARATQYGLNFDRYLIQANREISIVLQIEHKDAVNNIEAITQVEGITCLLIGPYDLSGSLGRLGQINHPEVVAAINYVKETCQNQEIPLGIFTPNSGLAQHYKEEGFQLICVGQDCSLLQQQATALLQAMQ